ncbi:ABC transporter permease [Occallatibacter riparius]|uniref:ABC transporter permease n=1 Tax=Occallatibacter riparius TaxID=1002689 RepID=A0A9J7BS57_9BACT|nr:ABC transporter permease [Occallatibacter riparius]UWZ85716.1 ABC transporter permease [Occallatibacter riparius]
MMRVLLQDVRFAFRQMLQKPGFALLVMLTMALGIGANAAIFSVLDTVLLRPLPYEKPEQLIKVWTRFTGIGSPNDQNWISAPEFQDLQQLNHSFSDLAAMEADSINLGVKGSPQRVLGAAVSPNLFGMLGAKAAIGRTFLPEEAQPGREKEVLLSYGLWRRVFGANPNVVGSTVDIDGTPMTVVGIMPADFSYPSETEIWAPLAFAPADLSENSRGNHGLEVLGRLRNGVSLAQAQADMDRAGRTIIEQHASYPYTKFNFGIILHPLLEETVGDVKPSLLVLMAAVVLVLLIACVNIANLLLTRATERQREMETRIALGASGRRVARQLLTESVLLALAGGALGLALTPLALKGLVAIAAKSLPRTVHASIDMRALALALGAAVLTGILFGLAPALQAARKRNFDALRTGRNTEGKHPKRMRNALVVCETAISLLLLVGAGLLLRSFAEVLKVDPGFKADGVLTMRVSLPGAVYGKPEQVRGFYNSLVDRVQRLPGVQAAGAVSALPLGDPGGSGTVTIDTQSVPLDQQTPEADTRTATPDYFKAMGVGLVAGRMFETRDADGAPRVAVVDESLAQTFWPGQDAVGKRLHFGGIQSKSPWMTVVGVVRHVRNRTLEARSRVEVYVPEAQVPFNGMTLAVKTSGDPMSLAPTIQREVASIDPDLPVYRVRTMTEVMGESVQRRKLALILLEVFAGLALALAGVGIYGVTSYGVAQRQVEIGVRMALGADRGKVLRMMIAGGMTTIAIGLAIGVALAPVVTRMMGGLLFEVHPADPLAIAGGAAVLVAMAFLAILIPARRATKVSPMKALRYE